MPLPPIDRTSSVQWRPLSTDLLGSGASGAVPVRPINAVNPVESADALGGGAIVRLSPQAQASEEVPRDWTLAETRSEAPEAPEPPPDPPLYQQLIDLVQSMWRASGNAVQIAEEINQTTLTERLDQEVRLPPDDGPLTYADPSVKRTGGA